MSPADEVTVQIGAARITVPVESAVRSFLNELLNPLLAGELVTGRLSSFDPPRATVNGPPVRIGEPWAGEGGIYAGIVRGVKGGPDCHVVMAEEDKNKINWKDAGAWALSLDGDGHRNFALPTRSEQALLYANLKDRFEAAWYWSSESYSGDAEYAWCQYFCYGGQVDDRKSTELRARAVRRIPIQ